MDRWHYAALGTFQSSSEGLNTQICDDVMADDTQEQQRGQKLSQLVELTRPSSPGETSLSRLPLPGRI